jgi:hypothetical protein
MEQRPLQSSGGSEYVVARVGRTVGSRANRLPKDASPTTYVILFPRLGLPVEL